MVEYGMDKAIHAKMDSKYDPEQEKEAKEWIEAVTGEKQGDQTFAEWLHSGIVLCDLANKLRPDSIHKVHKSKLAPMQRENINFFVNFARDIGVPEFSVFDVGDLYEEKNMPSVINCIHLVGGAVQVSIPDFAGPQLGIALTAEVTDKRRFSGVATDQSSGFSTSMDDAQQSMDSAGVVRTGKKLISPRPAPAVKSPRPAPAVASPRPAPAAAPSAAAAGYAAPAAPAAPAAAAAAGYSAPAAPVAPAAAPAVGATGATAGPTDDYVFGLDKELKDKMDGKYDHDLEKEVVDWIEAVLGEKKGDQSVAEWLHSGIVLCNLINAITPGKIKKVHTSKIAAFQYENINSFVNSARELGVPEHSVFSGVDLYEEKNMMSVISCIYTLGGVLQVACPNYTGPQLGIALNAKTTDTKREGQFITDTSAGFAAAMEVQKPTEHLDSIVR